MKGRLLAASPLLLILWLGGIPSVSARQADPPSRWYGNVGLTAGYFDRIIKDEDEDIPIDTLFHMRGEASLLLGYRAPRFSVSTQVKGQWVGKETDFEHASLNQKDEVKLKSRRTVLRQPSGSWRTDFQWKPSDRNQYNTFILYQLERDKTVGSTFDTHFLLEDEEDELQNYRLALWLEPGINVDYRTGTWHFRAEGALQSYGEQLTDERHFRDIAWDRPIPVGRLLTEWAPSKTHRLSLNATHAIKQPTYLQRCWYERQDRQIIPAGHGLPGRPRPAGSTRETGIHFGG